MFDSDRKQSFGSGLKMIVAAVVGILLGVGLCGLGGNVGGLTMAGVWGALLIVGSAVLLLVGIIVALVESSRRNDR